jgi:hypothetical protein
MGDASLGDAEVKGVCNHEPNPKRLPHNTSSPLSLLTRTPSISSQHSTGTTDTGDTIMMQGVPGGPPVSEWVFDDDIQERLDGIQQWRDEFNAHPSGPRFAEDVELFCECNGIDDGTPMVKCDNGVYCLKEWFHMKCIGMKPPGPDVGRKISRDFLTFSRKLTISQKSGTVAAVSTSKRVAFSTSNAVWAFRSQRISSPLRKTKPTPKPPLKLQKL